MLGRFFKKPAATRKVPPNQSLTERFPVLTYGPTQFIAPEQQQLRIWGAVEAERTWSCSELLALPQTTHTYDIHCVTHWSKHDTTWTGITLPELLAQVQLKPTARYAMIHSYGGYTTNLTLDDLNRALNLVAHSYEGQAISADHGGPLRLVVPHLYFWKSAKWISGIEILETEALGFWERNGYHKRGDPWQEERFDDE